MNRVKGWIFDLYPIRDGMALWLMTASGTYIRLLVKYAPFFFAAGPRSSLREVVHKLVKRGIPSSACLTERLNLFSNRLTQVLQVKVHNPLLFHAAVKGSAEVEEVELFNCDIPLPQLYLYETGIFPLAWCQIEYDDNKVIRDVSLLDNPWDTGYSIPPLTVIELRTEARANPNHEGRCLFVAGLEGKEYIFEDDPVGGINDLMRRYDPDIILSEWGDSYIIPHLINLARREGKPLALNREEGLGIASRRGRSYFTYGKVVYQAPANTLFGRWHLDRKNSFIMEETGLEGVLELARVSQIPVQRLARNSTGTAITSMQMSIAVRDRILIPWRKAQVEDFKGADELLTSDKGGLYYQPVIGFHEKIGELDFASMYPTLMAKYNLSPETVNCRCCRKNLVPEIAYNVCQRRKGIVPKTLEPILEKRSLYKRLKREAQDDLTKELYDQRQTALKWMLVTCFGYLGYRNARFGKIEAHECVTAWGREKLLRAKEIAEGRGFTLLHGITDSLWLHKLGASNGDYQELAEEISKVTEIPIAVEGVYKWICFLPSKVNPEVPVPNRFFGVFKDGRIKARGIEMRRSDMPPLIREAQRKMLNALAQAKDAREYEARIPLALDILNDQFIRLREGRVNLEELIFTRRLSKAPKAYKNNTLLAVVSRELLGKGVKLKAGEKIGFVICDEDAKIPDHRARAFSFAEEGWGYDSEKYAQLLLEAAEALLFPVNGQHVRRREFRTRRETGDKDASQPLYLFLQNGPRG